MLARVLRSRFRKIVRTEAGAKFYAEFGDPNAAPRPRREITNLPHRTMIVDRATPDLSGQRVTLGDVHFLLVGQHTMTHTTRYLAIEANTMVSWTREGTVIDPVSRVEKSAGPQVLDPALPVAMEPRSSFEEEDFQRYKSRIFTSADVQKGDFIDDMKVVQTFDLFGIRAAEIV